MANAPIDHAFNHTMRVAFHHTTIHERARIAFVAVANDVFPLSGRLGGVFPLQSRQETRAATSAQTAGGDRLDELRGRHAAEHLAGGAVTTGGAVRLERFRVNRAAIFQRDFFLFGQKPAHAFGAPATLEQILFNRLVTSDVAVENLLHAALIEMDVGPVPAAWRIKFEHRFAVTNPGAAGFVERNPRRVSSFFDQLVERLRAGGHAAGAEAHRNAPVRVRRGRLHRGFSR